nr:SpaA isopeptide-forming pilin-related protein [Corynebacterium pseudotuberculosis]
MFYLFWFSSFLLSLLVVPFATRSHAEELLASEIASVSEKSSDRQEVAMKIDNDLQATSIVIESSDFDSSFSSLTDSDFLLKLDGVQESSDTLKWDVSYVTADNPSISVSFSERTFKSGSTISIELPKNKESQVLSDVNFIILGTPRPEVSSRKLPVIGDSVPSASNLQAEVTGSFDVSTGIVTVEGKIKPNEQTAGIKEMSITPKTGEWLFTQGDDLKLEINGEAVDTSLFSASIIDKSMVLSFPADQGDPINEEASFSLKIKWDPKANNWVGLDSVVTAYNAEFSLAQPMFAPRARLTRAVCETMEANNIVVTKDRGTYTPYLASFILGSNGGGLISGFKINPGLGLIPLLPNAQGFTQSTLPYWMSIDGIINTRENTGQKVDYVFPKAGGAVYLQFEIAGTKDADKKYLRIYNQDPENPSMRDGSLWYRFVDYLGNPTKIEIPENTKVDIRFQTGSRIKNASTPSVNVDGCIEEFEETEPIAPLPPVDPNVDPTVCSPNAEAKVWVGMSQHTNRGETFNDRNSTDLYVQSFNRSTGLDEFKPVGARTPWVYNAMAYNPKDGYIYAISQGRIKTPQSSKLRIYDEDPKYPAGHLLQISPVNAGVKDLGVITGLKGARLTAWPNDVWGGMTSGIIDDKGRYLVSNSSQSGTHDLYQLDLDTRRATVVANKTAFSNDYTSTGKTGSNYVWGIKNSSNPVSLERIDVRDGSSKEFSLGEVKDPLGQSVESGIYGTAWTDGNGSLGFGNNRTGSVYQIDIRNESGSSIDDLGLKIVAKRKGPTSQNNDATSNGILSPVITDLKITKKLEKIEGNQVSWVITVENLGPCPSSGFTLQDIVPEGYTGVKGEPQGEGWYKEDLSVKENVINASHGPLRGGEKATYKVTANQPSSNSEKCLQNTASIYANEKDPVEDNNTASDGACLPSITKTVVDQNNDGKIDGQDGSVAAENGLRKVTYKIEVKNPKGFPETKYSLTDTPQFAASVKLERLKVTSDYGKGNQEVQKPIPDSGLVLAEEDTSIAGSASEDTIHTYMVEAFYSGPESPVREEADECKDSTPKFGLFNSAKLKVGVSEKTSEGCVPIVRNVPIKIQLKKVDAESKETELQATFDLYRVSDGVKIATLQPRPNQQAQTEVEPGKYRLIETQSPVGYQLLPRPVDFEVIRTADGKADVTIDAASFPLSKSADQGKDPNLVILTVADVRVGTLPKTGGHGVAIYLVMGALLVLVGVSWSLYRNQLISS